MFKIPHKKCSARFAQVLSTYAYLNNFPKWWLLETFWQDMIFWEIHLFQCGIFSIANRGSCLYWRRIYRECGSCELLCLYWQKRHYWQTMCPQRLLLHWRQFCSATWDSGSYIYSIFWIASQTQRRITRKCTGKWFICNVHWTIFLKWYTKGVSF